MADVPSIAASYLVVANSPPFELHRCIYLLQLYDTLGYNFLIRFCPKVKKKRWEELDCRDKSSWFGAVRLVSLSPDRAIAAKQYELPFPLC